MWGRIILKFDFIFAAKRHQTIYLNFTTSNPQLQWGEHPICTKPIHDSDVLFSVGMIYSLSPKTRNRPKSPNAQPDRLQDYLGCSHAHASVYRGAKIREANPPRLAQAPVRV
jgi:hypothetical protein